MHNFKRYTLALLILGCIIALFAQGRVSYANKIKLGESPLKDTISYSQLTEFPGDSIVKAFFKFQDELYTGCAVQKQKAQDGMWSFVFTFESGVLQRMDVYGINGYRHRFVEMKNGHEIHTIMFHRNGNMYLETFHTEKREKTGVWKRWREDGSLEWEKSYGDS